MEKEKRQEGSSLMQAGSMSDDLCAVQVGIWEHKAISGLHILGHLSFLATAYLMIISHIFGAEVTNSDAFRDHWVPK